MKKLSLVLAGIMLASTVLFAGCGAKKEETKETGDGTTGGWTVAEAVPAEVSSDVKKVVESAKGTITGSDITPIALLATQVVSGTNYAVLCEVTPVTQNPTPHYSVVYIYQDLQGKTEINGFVDIDPAAEKDTYGTEQNSSGQAGGWSIAEIKGVKEADYTKALEEALQSFTGSDFEPVELLATQVVSGTNYSIFCKGATVTQTPTEYFAIVRVYKDTQGKCEITDIVNFDIAAMNPLSQK